MQRSELLRLVANRAGTTQPEAGRVIDEFLELVVMHLAAGEDVRLRNFGVFESKKMTGAKRPHPQTGVVIDCPDRNVVRFRASEGVKRRLNSNG